jgi:hypothetical protein
MAAVTELATAVGTRADMLTLSELEKLPLRRGWGVKELQSYLAHPTAGTTWHWWWQTPEGTAVSAEVAAAVGRRLLKEETDGPQKATECWSGFISSRPSLVHEWVERYSTQPVLGGLGSVLAPYQMLVALYYTSTPPALRAQNSSTIFLMLRQNSSSKGSGRPPKSSIRPWLQSTSNAYLYTTTFPCHNCTRHIIASGIRKLVYIEPYPKSKAKDLHSDAICFDEEEAMKSGKIPFVPFVGVGPRRYLDLFSSQLSGGIPVERRDRDGKPTRWEKRCHKGSRVPMEPFNY